MSDEQAVWNAAFAPPKFEKVDGNEYEQAYNDLFKKMITKEQQNESK